jgi:hypothetical protein
MVADAMKERQKTARARFVVNVGDSFYWGGFEDTFCGGDPTKTFDLEKASNHGGGAQWKHVFEDMYDLPHPDEPQYQIPWLGCMGNHDYGGMHHQSGWDHQVFYTYKDEGKGRWRMPGQYWKQEVDYKTFSLDMYFIDGNFIDASGAGQRRGHNICYAEKKRTCDGFNHAGYGEPNIFWQDHNKRKYPKGSMTITNCRTWFHDMWAEQMVWLKEHFASSRAHWIVLVNHYPNAFDEPRLKPELFNYGVDIVAAGHTHWQTQKHIGGGPLNIISGGGGGIAAEFNPSATNNAYGFVHIKLTKDELTSSIINQDGHEITAGANGVKTQQRRKKKWESGGVTV